MHKDDNIAISRRNNTSRLRASRARESVIWRSYGHFTVFDEIYMNSDKIMSVFNQIIGLVQ